MRPLLNGAQFGIAYNEFCGPTLPEAVEELIGKGVEQITVVSTMFTPGGSHSEFEIPEELQELRARHPDVTLNYAWPFDLRSGGENALWIISKSFNNVLLLNHSFLIIIVIPGVIS